MVDRLSPINAVDCLQRRCQLVALRANQGQRRATGTFEEDELEAELETHLAEVSDGALQPRGQEAAARRGDAVHAPLRPGVTGLDPSRASKALGREAIDGAVRERTANGEHASDRTGGRELASDREAVARALREHTQHGVLGQRQSRRLHVRSLIDRGPVIAVTRPRPVLSAARGVVALRLLEDVGPMRRRGLASLAAVALLLGACSSNVGGGEDLEGELLVSAAASLTDAFGDIEAAFEEANPDIDVVLNLGASSALREQILEGAPADVFASANTSNMDQVVDAEEASDPEIFVTNLLQIAVPEGNPGSVTGLEDFANDELLIGLCEEAVPCGDFARQALENAGVTPSIDSNEPDVRALLTKVEAGELDAGIVYVTDVQSTDGAVEGVDIPEEDNVVAEYPIAPLTNAPNPDAAAAFVAFVLSDEGQEILGGYGFGAP